MNLVLRALIIILSTAPTTAPAQQDAADLYLRAEAAVREESPTSSDMIFKSDYPPFEPRWDEVAAKAFEANADARRLAHEARGIDRADWPHFEISDYLNRCRALTNELADASLYQH